MFKLQRSKVLLLRVTIPMDFYTSPITVEVDGVDVQLKVLADEGSATSKRATGTHADSADVPNTVDLAQSFLDTESLSERQKLQEALNAETQDLGASLTVSEDGSDEDLAYGTGQALSLPVFLADFLQSILDRMQIKIKGINFQLHMDVPTEPGSTKTEPISFQISLETIDIEGVTTPGGTGANDESPAIVPKEGKRQISVANIRAYLISEANVFASLTRSPSLASPSTTSSPRLTRNPPSRQSSSLSQASLASDNSLSQNLSFQEHLSAHSERDDAFPLGDSEEALGIPYDLEEGNDEDESPPTPRASVYHDLGGSFGNDDVSAASSYASLQSDTAHTLTPSGIMREMPFRSAELGASSGQLSAELAGSQVSQGSVESQPHSDELSESHLYTHEEAESMYMSAFSQGADRSTAEISHDKPLPDLATEGGEGPSPQTSAASPPSAMPGAWDDDKASSMQASREVAKEIGATVEEEQTSASLAGETLSTADSNSAQVPTTTFAEALESPCIEPPAQDDIPTPKCPTRIVKRIVELSSLSVYIPSHHRHIQVQSPHGGSIIHSSQSLDRSIFPQAPGAFSVHGPSMSSPESATEPQRQANTETDENLEIILSPVTVNFDASLAFLLSVVFSRLLDGLKDKTSPKKPEASKGGTKPQDPPPIKLVLEALSVNFLNRLGGVADTVDRHLDPAAFTLDHEVLLNLTLEHLSLSRAAQSPPAKKTAASDIKAAPISTNIELQKFRFGYANGDIISFDGGKPMSTSVRDTFLSTGYDIAIKMTEFEGNIRTEVETLPLVIQVELQRLDETFSWFGGLSSFLNMSASMAPSPDQTPKSASLPPQKPRGVRFDTPIDPGDKSAASSNKLNVRIGGTYVELLGRECCIAAESNAVKLVSRDEGVGIACSLIRVSGPFINGSMADPAISTEISAVRLDFLMTPKDTDLEKLLELIIPSKVKYDHTTDEIMVDTLLRQRRKGSVLRATTDGIHVRIKNVNQLSVLPNLGEEVAKLSTVAKYLPEDDRPGLLTLGKVQRVSANIDSGSPLGHISAEVKEFEIGHITIPSLVAVSTGSISVKRNKAEELISTIPFTPTRETPERGPVFMARMIGDEIEPVVKLKLHHLLIEYRVPTIMDILGLADDATPQDFEDSLAASVANLGDQTQHALSRSPASPVQTSKPGKPMKLDVAFKDCMFGLNPLKLPSKMIIALTESHLDVTLPKNEQMKAMLDVNKASVLLIDDVSVAESEAFAAATPRRSSQVTSPQIAEMCAHGYVDVCYISSAKIIADVAPGADGERQVKVDLRDDLLVLETCADSTQTLITLANALKPPTPPSKENKYRTNVVPVQDLLASISAEAFGKAEGEYDFDQDFAGAQEMAGSGSELEYGSDNSLRIESQFYGGEESGEELFDATKSILSQGTTMEDTNEGVLLTGFDPATSQGSVDSDELLIHEDFYGKESAKVQTAKVWNSAKNSYDDAPTSLVRRSPVKVSVRDVHLIWNLFDGYDWQSTRDVISKAVQDVETRAYERQARSTGQQAYEEELDDAETIGDFLFNSIYIGIPANRDPQELSRAINEGLNDNATETESVATTAFTTTTSAPRGSRRRHPKPKRLRLQRSKHHKVTFELQGVNADLVVYPPGTGETVSSIDVRVQQLDIFDHVPTSTWKKFATYDQDKGEREMGTSMVHLEVLNVKPMPELGASEIVLRATVLPLRLHVDQDALDFITRFFEFKDEKVPVHASPSDIPFVQRAEVNNIPVKLDFKPKRVDYAGLRSGHTTEFMNFIVLEEARMVLRHVIIYGVSGFDRLGKTLNDIWMPDVRTNQLPGVIAGLAPVRSLVNIGSGFKDLVEIPLREYQKDGRVVRSISKGAAAFARTTGTEIVKLGAKLAVGTQYALQGAEDMLVDKPQDDGSWDDDDLDEEDKKQISLYADQPTGVIQGIRGGYRSLARDVNVARDAIIAVPGEVMESGTAAGAARAVWKRAPTIIFRPAVGMTKVIGQTLMGATNAIDPQNRRRIGEVSLKTIEQHEPIC